MSRITNIKRPVIDLQATGKQIKSLMNAGKITVRDLQGLFGFEYPQAIYSWLNGRNLPTVDNLLILSEFLGVTMDEIVIKRYVEVERKISA